MNKRKVLSVTAIALVFFSFLAGFSLGNDREDTYKQLDVFAEAVALVETKYVEEKDPKDLMYGAMGGMLASLDSYSQFLTPEEYNELLEETEGKFGGLGVEITLRDGLLTVVSPIEGTPAWDAGLEAGDIIVKINGELTRDITLHEAVKKLRGDPGTEVTITILREKIRKVEDVTIVRDIIKIQDIKRSLILDDGIGYLRIVEFRENTAKDLAKALGDLKKNGLKGLIIDVRSNPGGLLSTAIDVASLFLPDGQVVVSTDSRTEEERIYKSVSLKGKVLDVPIVVLINKGSASASEILAAALRENGRAILLGETTFGKGSVQTIIPLSDDSALRLTTSKYYTPKGISIHEKGIDPDIEVKLQKIEEQPDDIFDNLEEQKDAAPNPDEFNYKKDYQIVRALDLIRGLLVLNSSE